MPYRDQYEDRSDAPTPARSGSAALGAALLYLASITGTLLCGLL
jgi:hypothetical protein